MASPDARTRIIAQKLFELANIEAGVIVFSELLGREGVRWGLVVTGLGLFAVLYALGYILLSPRRSKPVPPLQPMSEWLPPVSPESSQPSN
jgi:predicted permease